MPIDYANLKKRLDAGKRSAGAVHGAIAKMTMGNDVVETRKYNRRLQPEEIKAVVGTTELLKLGNAYSATQNNGNIQSQTITVLKPPPDPTFTVTQDYSYL